MRQIDKQTLAPSRVGRPPVLDIAPGAAAAYSLRALSESWTGPVVTVRRSSDSAEADFTATEVSDGTLAAWCGAGDGFVKTWWDQSGNARDATEATYQPKIVAGGVPITEDGKPALQFATTNAVGLSIRLQTAAFPTPIPQPATAFLVSTNHTTDDRQFPFDGRLNQFAVGGTVDAGYQLSSGATIAAATGPNTSTNLFSGLFNGSSSEMYIAGALAASGNAGANQLDGITIGNIRGAPGPIADNYTFIGTISELIIYPADMTAQREAIEGNLAWYY